MIRLRSSGGEEIPVPEGVAFVELVDGSDPEKPILRVFAFPSPGEFWEIKPGSPTAQRYERLFAEQKLKFIRGPEIRRS